MYVPVKSWGDRKKTKARNGYILVWVPEHPKSFRGGWYYEHRLVCEEAFGRLLEHWETVHHINHDRSWNHPDNLFVCSRTDHDRIS